MDLVRRTSSLALKKKNTKSPASFPDLHAQTTTTEIICWVYIQAHIKSLTPLLLSAAVTGSDWYFWHAHFYLLLSCCVFTSLQMCWVALWLSCFLPWGVFHREKHSMNHQHTHTPIPSCYVFACAWHCNSPLISLDLLLFELQISYNSLLHFIQNEEA